LPSTRTIHCSAIATLFNREWRASPHRVPEQEVWKAARLRYLGRVKLLLIDGHYYVYRSFFAIQNLSNSRGEPTNAIFGFTKTLRLMTKHLQPELGAVFWDEGLPEKRMTLQPAYKETRKEMPQPMIPQLNFIQEELTALLGFKNISLPNTEADDLMGCYTLAACTRTTRTFTSSSGPA
jgi:5'-3' exonuclease